MALGARLRAEQAAVAIAERDYYPDLDVVGRYDAFWQKADRNLAPLVGVNLNVPLDNERRRAAIREAQYRANQQGAELEAKLDEVQNDVAVAYRQLEESRRTLELFDKSILPVAEQNLASAQSNYTANKIDFLRLIEAARQSVMLREKREEASPTTTAVLPNWNASPVGRSRPASRKRSLAAHRRPAIRSRTQSLRGGVEC